MPIIVGAPQPPQPDPRDRELEELRRENATLRVFVDAVRAEHAEKGHITRTEIGAALARLDDATK